MLIYRTACALVDSQKFLAKRARVEGLYSKVQELQPLKQRQIAAILGACVADAASRPLHWIYNQDILDRVVGDADPAFWPQNQSPFYSRPTGEHSCYNDESTCMLRSLVAAGTYNEESYVHELKLMFQEGTDYDRAFKERNRMYNPDKKNEWTKPVPGPWLHASVIEFLKNYASRVYPTGHQTLAESDGFCGTIPLISACAGQVTLLTNVEGAVRVLTNNDQGVSHAIAAARILDAFIQDLPDPVHYTLQHESIVLSVRDEINAVLEAINQPHTPTVAMFGKACGYPGNFQGALHAVLKATGFQDGVRMVIKAGGCNCSRANLAGACLGAKYGITSIPLEWTLATSNGLEVLEMAILVAGSEVL